MIKFKITYKEGQMKYIILLILLSGCGAVTKDQWKRAEELCEPNNGVAVTWATVFNDTVEARCNNGVDVEVHIVWDKK
jgi:hypothetical protein